MAKNKRQIITFLAISMPVTLFYLTIGCPLRFFTGICCPGCGMTRALWYCLRFDFVTAFHMHPLIFIMPFVALIYIFRKKFPEKTFKVLTIAFFILMAAVYIIRLLGESDVVYIDTSRGFIFKIIQFISGGI